MVSAQAGDREAFDALATAMYDRLYAVACRILRDGYAAEEAVQESLIRGWRELRSLRDPSRFEAWMHRLLINSCHDQGRRSAAVRGRGRRDLVRPLRSRRRLRDGRQHRRARAWLPPTPDRAPSRSRAHPLPGHVGAGGGPGPRHPRRDRLLADPLRRAGHASGVVQRRSRHRPTGCGRRVDERGSAGPDPGPMAARRARGGA